MFKKKKGEEKNFLPEKNKNQPLAKVITPPSNVPLGNHFNKKRIEGYTKVVKAEEELMKALVDQTKTKERLLDIDIEIETDRRDREIKLREKEREAMLQGRKDRLAELKLEVEEAEWLERLDKIAEKPKSSAEEYRQKKEEKRKQDNIDNEYQRKKQLDKVENEFDTRKEMDDLFKKIRKENLQQFLKKEGLEDMGEANLEQHKRWKEIEQVIKNRFYQEYLKNS